MTSEDKSSRAESSWRLKGVVTVEAGSLFHNFPLALSKTTKTLQNFKRMASQTLGDKKRLRSRFNPPESILHYDASTEVMPVWRVQTQSP